MHILKWSIEKQLWTLFIPQENTLIKFDNVKENLREGFLVGYMKDSFVTSWKYTEEDITELLDSDYYGDSQTD
jgi:hypothetical protein